jgi:cell division protein FtsX
MRALHNMGRSKKTLVFSVATIGLSFFLLFMLTTLVYNFYHMVARVDQNIVGVAFLSAADASEANQIQNSVQNLSESIFTELINPNSTLKGAQAVQSDLPWVLVVQSHVDDVALNESIYGQVSQLRGIEELVRPDAEIARAKWIMGLFYAASLLVSFLLAILVVVVVMNAVKMSALHRQSELDLMRLVGATENFVRTPFVVEGFLHGLAGVMLALIFVGIFHAIFSDAMGPGLAFHALPSWAFVLLFFLAGALSALGAFWSVSKNREFEWGT